MSRSWAGFIAGALALGTAAAPLAAQESAQASAEADARIAAVIEEARTAYAPPARTRCGAGSADEIVVCAPDAEQHRVSPTSATDPLSREATSDGVPRGPDFSRLPSCAVARCQGWAPPPIYIIDLKAIPEAPADSDADRIARGEMAAP